MQTLYISYIDLTPGIENKFSMRAHKSLIESLRKSFLRWKGFLEKHPQFSIGLIVATKQGIENIQVKGPTIHRKRKVVDFSIFLPNKEYNLSEYVDFIFNGIIEALKPYNITKEDVLSAWDECKSNLN